MGFNPCENLNHSRHKSYLALKLINPSGMMLNLILLISDLLIERFYFFSFLTLKTRNSCLVILDSAVTFLNLSRSFSGFLWIDHGILHLSELLTAHGESSDYRKHPSGAKAQHTLLPSGT